MLLRTFDDAIRASRLRPYFWVPKALAARVRAALPDSWVVVGFRTEQRVEGEPAVCFKHSARSEVVCRVMDRQPITVAAARYMRAAYGPAWRQLAA